MTAQLTPPVPCVTTTVPFLMSILSRTFIPVPAAPGRAAASSKDKFLGARMSHWSCTTMYCLRVPSIAPAPRLLFHSISDSSPSTQSRIGTIITAAPTLSFHVLPGPTLTISPAPSKHGMRPGAGRIGYKGESARQRRSRKLRAAARTRTRTDPGPGVGIGDSFTDKLLSKFGDRWEREESTILI
jgi:hypothetical protein